MVWPREVLSVSAARYGNMQRSWRKKAFVLSPYFEVTLIPNRIVSQHCRPLPRNNAPAESLSLMSAGIRKGISRVNYERNQNSLPRDPHAVSDCENGRFVSTNNTVELVGTSDKLISDDRQRKRPGDAACQTIPSQLTMQRELDAKLSLYSRLGLKM